MANSVTTSITRVKSIISNPRAISDSHTLNDHQVTLDLLVHITRKVVHRDVEGRSFPIFDSTDLSKTRAPRFRAKCLEQPGLMREILKKALGLVFDKASVNGLSKELLDCFVRTRSLHLGAEFEVVQTTVMMSREEEDQEDEEWREAVDAMKVDCGFESGGRELGTCSICFDELKKKLIQTHCSHLYHESCIESWLEKSNSCPLCRTQVLSLID